MGNMSDNLIIQAFNTLFIYNMCEVLQDAYDVPPTLLSLFLGFSSVLNIFFSEKYGLTTGKRCSLYRLNPGFLGKKFEIFKKDTTTLPNNCQVS